MNELKFRVMATAVLKTADKEEVLREIDIDVMVSEAIRVAGTKIEDCPGPLGGFWEAVGYAGDVLFGCGDENPKIGMHHVIEVMWGMPNWLCVTRNGCWDCMYDGFELGNRSTTYLSKEDRETMTIRIDGLYAVQYKRNGATGWSEKSEARARLNALRDLVQRAGLKVSW